MNKQKKLAKQNTPLYKRVPTLNLVDYSDIEVPLVVIYDSPKDFPGKVVARVWDGEKAGQQMFTANMKISKDAKKM